MMLVPLALFLFLVSAGSAANAPDPCAALATCADCTSEWHCVWCPTAANGTAHCMHGSIIGQSSCDKFKFQWRQCTFAGWILVLIIAGSILLILLLILICCCCCCCRRRRRRNRQRGGGDSRNIQYGELDNPVYKMDAPPSTYQQRPAPAAVSSPTPKSNEWRERMAAKYGVQATPSTGEADGWN